MWCGLMRVPQLLQLTSWASFNPLWARLWSRLALLWRRFGFAMGLEPPKAASDPQRGAEL